MKSKASAVWQGGFKDGKGTVSASAGAFANIPYSYTTRFEGTGQGTTPEELIAAAHAGCFAMATSFVLGNAGFTPTRLDVKATVTMEPVDGKPTVTSSHLELEAMIPGIDNAKFLEIANGAKSGCVVSRLLKAEISLDARLTG